MPAEEPAYDFFADEMETIPDDATPEQCATLLLSRADIIESRPLLVIFASGIAMVRKTERCMIGDATRRLLERVTAAQKAGETKWKFWLEDGGWKDPARAPTKRAANDLAWDEFMLRKDL